jgi:hypothetical protein
MVWKPIAKLMRRVQRTEQNALYDVASNPLHHVQIIDNGDVNIEASNTITLQDSTMFGFSEWDLDNNASIELINYDGLTKAELDGIQNSSEMP